MVAACTLGAVLTPAFYVLVQEFVDKFPKKKSLEKIWRCNYEKVINTILIASVLSLSAKFLLLLKGKIC